MKRKFKYRPRARALLRVGTLSIAAKGAAHWAAQYCHQIREGVPRTAQGPGAMTAAALRRQANERKRRYRARLRDGKVLVTFEIDELGVIGLLSHHGLLAPCAADKDGAIDCALRQLVERLIIVGDEQRRR
jgi:hypothetical protein